MVVDASVLLACLFKDGKVRDLIATSDEIHFVAPAYMREEVQGHLVDVAKRSGLSVETVQVVFEDVLSFLELVPQATYHEFLPQAQQLARSARAQGDEEYVALAMALRAPIWTLDKDFRRIPGLATLRTSDLRDSPE